MLANEGVCLRPQQLGRVARGGRNWEAFSNDREPNSNQ